MNEKYYVTLYFENGNTANVLVTANAQPNLEGRIQSADWLKCEDSEVVFNMSKVLSYELSKVDN